jgi:hypothetical protein
MTQAFSKFPPRLVDNHSLATADLEPDLHEWPALQGQAR